MLEPHAITKYNIWRQEQSEEIVKKKQELVKSLTESVPSSLKNFVSDNYVISDLFEKGEASLRRSRSEMQQYNIASLEALENKLLVLGKNWENVVKITISYEDSKHRIKIHFKAF